MQVFLFMSEKLKSQKKFSRNASPEFYLLLPKIVFRLHTKVSDVNS